MIYVYGLVDVPALLPQALLDCAGQQSSVEETTIGSYTLIFEQHDGSDVQPRRRNMLIHTRILERVMAFGTVLPARFGLLTASPAIVAQRVADKQTEIAAEFAKLSGCIELGIRVSYPRSEALAATLAANTALQARRNDLATRGAEAHFDRADFGRALADAMDRRRGDAQKLMISALRPHLKDYVLRRPETDVEILRLEALLPADAEADFLAALDKLTHDCSFAPGAEPAIQIVGPAPAYHFVHLSLAADDRTEDNI